MASYLISIPGLLLLGGLLLFWVCWKFYQDIKEFSSNKENDEKLLVKSEDEYTSVIVKIFKVENEFIILTENSLYIVNSQCPTKRIS